MSNIYTLAKELSQAFESATRPNGDEFRKLKDGSPEWMQDAIREAHSNGDMLPDDWRYRFIEDAADTISECENEVDIDNRRDEIDADAYTHDLTAWLHSRNDRVYYLTQALEEGLDFKDGFQLLAWAQLMEKREVFDQVLSALQSRADEAEAA